MESGSVVTGRSTLLKTEVVWFLQLMWLISYGDYCGLLCVGLPLNMGNFSYCTIQVLGSSHSNFAPKVSSPNSDSASISRCLAHISYLYDLIVMMRIPASLAEELWARFSERPLSLLLGCQGIKVIWLEFAHECPPCSYLEGRCVLYTSSAYPFCSEFPDI